MQPLGAVAIKLRVYTTVRFYTKSSICADDGTRTRNLLVGNEVPYQLSYIHLLHYIRVDSET